MRTVALLACALCLLGLTVSAQNHSLGYFVVGASGNTNYVSMKGSVSTLTVGTGTMYATTMHADNETALVLDYAMNSIVKVDLNTLTVVGTFFTSTLLTTSANVYDMCFDHNGDFFFCSSSTSGVGKGVFKVDASSTRTVVTMATASTQPFYYPENLEIDIDTGELLVADDSSTFLDQINILKRDGSSYTKVANGFNFRYGSHKDMNTGTIYSGTCCNSSNRSMLYVKTGVSTASTFLVSAVLQGSYDPMLDRASAAMPRIVSSAWSTGTSGGIHYVDLATKTVTQLTQIAHNTYDLEFAYGRNIQSVKTGAGQWSINLDVPAHPGKVYVIALSIAGPRPGVTLPDGRVIPLKPDAITFATAAGSLPPIFTGNIGILDKAGEGVAKLDLSAFPKSALGLKIWIGAVVLDPAAPLGIALIPDTKVLVLD